MMRKIFFIAVAIAIFTVFNVSGVKAATNNFNVVKISDLSITGDNIGSFDDKMYDKVSIANIDFKSNYVKIDSDIINQDFKIENVYYGKDNNQLYFDLNNDVSDYDVVHASLSDRINKDPLYFRNHIENEYVFKLYLFSKNENSIILLENCVPKNVYDQFRIAAKENNDFVSKMDFWYMTCFKPYDVTYQVNSLYKLVEESRAYDYKETFNQLGYENKFFFTVALSSTMAKIPKDGVGDQTIKVEVVDSRIDSDYKPNNDKNTQDCFKAENIRIEVITPENLFINKTQMYKKGISDKKGKVSLNIDVSINIGIGPFNASLTTKLEKTKVEDTELITMGKVGNDYVKKVEAVLPSGYSLKDKDSGFGYVVSLATIKEENKENAIVRVNLSFDLINNYASISMTNIEDTFDLEIPIEV